MYIRLDKQTMTLQVQVGVLETYEPSQEIKDLLAQTMALKEQMEDFMKNVVEPQLKEIESKIDEQNKKFVK